MIYKIRIDIAGCDATTELQYDVNEQQLSVIKDLARRSQRKSQYQCEPKIYIKIIKSIQNDPQT